MIPKTFSSTSMHVASLCLDRYEAEQFSRGRGLSGIAATLGSTVHAALEKYVQTVYIDKTHAPDLSYLEMLFKMFHMAMLGSSEVKALKDGLDMVRTWHERTDFSTRTVLSVEQKRTFDLKTKAGIIPFTYIMDRLDMIGPNEYEIVDYKSSVWPVYPADLEFKIQPRAYALAVQIMYPEAEKIWVRFDMLRHDAVARVFSKAENAATWHELKRIANMVIDTPEGSAPATLNTECRFCVKKVSCGLVARNAAVGGILSMSREDIIDRRTVLGSQIAAINAAIAEIDTWLVGEAEAADVNSFESDINRVSFNVSKRRTVDPDMVQRIIGDDLFSFWGGRSISMANFDKLLKSDQISDDKKGQLRALVNYTYGDTKVAISAKKDDTT